MVEIKGQTDIKPTIQINTKQQSKPSSQNSTIHFTSDLELIRQEIYKFRIQNVPIGLSIP